MPLFLSGVFLLLAAAAPSSAQRQLVEEISSFQQHPAYLDWVDTVEVDYGNSVFLDAGNGNGAAVHYRIEDDIFYMGIAVKATGWLGFGLAEAGGML